MFKKNSKFKRDIEVLSSPAFANRETNPYNSLIYDHMIKGKANVADYSDIRLLAKRCDIVHIHWPEYFFFFTDPNTFRMIWRSLFRLFCLYLSLMKGTKVFWTVHNLNPHEERRPRLEKFIVAMMIRRVNSLIVLNRDSHRQICERYPSLKKKPVNFIPICHFRTVYWTPFDKADAKATYGIKPEITVLGYFGRIRPYKNVSAMIRTFREIDDPNVRLLISGECSDSSLKREISSLATEDSRIRLWLEDLSTHQLANVVTACDVAVLPFKTILNSASAFLSLSLNRPLLLPDTEAFRELVEEVGEDWIHLYRGELTASDLRSVVSWARQECVKSELGLEQFHPQHIADTTLAAYKAELHRA